MWCQLFIVTIIAAIKIMAINRSSALVNPPPGDEVVISGIAGYFPKCNSVFELQEKLFNKVDLITDEAFGNHYSSTIESVGKINKLDKFDGTFFKKDFVLGHCQDPMGRLLLERTYEALIDAGINPRELHNTKTGVYIGACFLESEPMHLYDNVQKNLCGVIGCSRASIASEISNWLQITGPSYVTDTACSSSMFALEHAYKAIREGHCEAAVVGGVNLVLSPKISTHFESLGVLSPDGRCKSFDSAVNGYVRSEAAGVCILQKAKDSRRIYAQIVHTKTNCDGFTEQGITYPAMEVQKRLLREVYEECSIPPQNVQYMECHGTGTPVGDPQELGAIDAILCSGRTEPLLIGSVKSNLGHSEPGAGICSIAKLCIAYNSGYIPPNINFRNVLQNVPALVEGRLLVVTDKIPWNRGLSGVNSLGFGGANAHVLLKNIAKDKESNGLPHDGLPRLVCVSGRTASAVNRIISSLESKPVDVEEVRLWHKIHEYDIEGHGFRGYTLLEGSKGSIHKNIKPIVQNHKRVCFVYPNRTSNWISITKQLLQISAFSDSFQKCHDVLKPKGIDLINLITKGYLEVESINSYILQTVFQIGVTDIFTAVGIKPDYVMGRGAGEIACAYADGCLPLEHAVLVAYYSAVEYAIGVNNGNTCNNGPHAPNLIDLTDILDNVINDLTANKIDTTQFDNDLKLLRNKSAIITYTKHNSKRWLQISADLGKWIFPEPKLSFKNFPERNLTHEAYQKLSPDCILIDISAQSTLTNVEEIIPNATSISLGSDNKTNGLHNLLKAFGELFQAGLNPCLANIYPPVPFPVSQGTPMLSHLVEWYHEEEWLTEKNNLTEEKSQLVERTFKISFEDNKYLSGHIVDGRVLYPGMGYVVLVWETLASLKRKIKEKVSVVFEDVYFERSTVIPKTGHLDMIVTIHKITGEFEVSENNTTVARGFVYAQNNIADKFCTIKNTCTEESKDVIKNTRLNSNDFYKECRLRGYGHSGDFQGIIESDLEGTRFKINWIENWVVFLDSMLQSLILKQDSTNTLIPTRVQKLSIDTVAHNASVQTKTKTIAVEAYSDKYSNVCRTPGIEIRGAHFVPVVKKPALWTPVLEKHVFVPFENSNLENLSDALRTCVQLVIENTQAYKLKCLEVTSEEYKKTEYKPLIENIANILQDEPMTNSEFVLLTNEEIQMPETISVTNKMGSHKNFAIVIAANVLEKIGMVEQWYVMGLINNNGFIISRETNFDKHKCTDNFDVVSVIKIKTDDKVECLVLLRKKILKLKEFNFVEVKTIEASSWVDKVKEANEKDDTVLVIYSVNEYSGLLGFINCLRKEPGGDKVRGLFIKDPSAPPFDPNSDFYKQQLGKNLTINVYEHGQWGTYRHLLLKDLDTPTPVYHAYNTVETIGDLTSLKWFEGPLDANVYVDPQMTLVHVYCAALNFRDVVTATGRVAVDAVCQNRLYQDCVQGLEVVGKTANGTRVMGMPYRGISNMTLCNRNFVMAIPDEWSFEEAATVFVAYSTVYSALVIFGKIKRGESVLIHAGTGGVGQAAINVALSYGCEVFTTVGTEEKRAFIKKVYPQIKDSHIGCSRDTSFEEMIQRETKGKGVDVVLNSLAEDKLLATARCLAYRGRFLEIGKVDIFKNTPIEMCFHEKEVSFHGIMLDFIYEDKSATVRQRLLDLMVQGIASGAVRPLTYTTFGKDEVESAYRYMASGRHVGKVIIKLRDEEPRSTKCTPIPLAMEAVRRYNCHPDKVYILVGGLGGFGLELANWLILRGARKLVLVSRSGVTNGYQSLKLRRWKSYGAEVIVSVHDAANESGCKEMLEKANTLGQVEAVFHLAVVLKDATLQHQDSETFNMAYAPKVTVALNLDKLTRILCPQLKDFVMFSSVTSGRGNAGQTNYGYANSVMERLCEKRRREGLPGLAIQWGAIGDVGILQEKIGDTNKLSMDIAFQSIDSCLRTLDKFLTQDAVVVSSFLPAEKKVTSEATKDAVDLVANIMGIKDLKTVSVQTTLADLGMDSMVAMEIKQSLERNFEIFLSPKELRSLTFARLKELSSDQQKSDDTNVTTAVKVEESVIETKETPNKE